MYGLLVVVLLVLVQKTDSLYFHIQEGERKCFIEEIPDDTLVVGMFSVICIYICTD